MNTPAKCRYAERHLIFLPPPACRQLYSTGGFLAPYLLLPSAERIPLADARLPSLPCPVAFGTLIFSSLLLSCLVFSEKEIWKGERNPFLLPGAETSGYRLKASLAQCAQMCMRVCLCIYVQIYLCVHR